MVVEFKRGGTYEGGIFLGGCGILKGAFCKGDTAGSGVLLFLACGADPV